MLLANVEQHYGNALLNVGKVPLSIEVLRRAAMLASSIGGVIYVEALLNLSVAYKASADDVRQRTTLEIRCSRSEDGAP